jgi:hypothetical protein
MAARRLEDRIRELADRLLMADEVVLRELISELQAALSEHTRRVQNKTSATILAWPIVSRERRKTRVA